MRNRTARILPWTISMLLLTGCSGDSSRPVPSFPVNNPSEIVPSQPPTSGPYFHTLRTASSVDGLVWTEDRPVDLALHASVPAAVELNDGTIVIYFVDFSSGAPERLGCIESKDGGVTYSWGNCSVAGLALTKAVDFAPVKMPDGSVLMYFYASDMNVNSAGPHTIDVASSLDGKIFTRSSTVFSYNGLVDPDVFWNGQEWIMHVFSLTDGGTVRATSTDAISFQFKDYLQPAKIGVTKPTKLSDGSFRMYGFPQGANQQVRFVSLRSTDGYAWTQEPGDRLAAPSGYEITDPYAIQLQTGKWLMVYKRSVLGK